MRVHKKRDGWMLIADDGAVLRYMNLWQYLAYLVRNSFTPTPEPRREP